MEGLAIDTIIFNLQSQNQPQKIKFKSD